VQDAHQAQRFAACEEIPAGNAAAVLCSALDVCPEVFCTSLRFNRRVCD
jgi:hypothetical protein